MNPFKLYKIAGMLSIVFGVLGAVCLVNIRTVPAALLLAVTGFIFAGINIFIDAKYEIHDRKFPLGYIGMILSSLPVLFLLAFIFLRR
ncbi:MAG: hypothetical protein JNK50_03620 [Bacteroidia bacterium]|nr:hypothetical protein [Bacteroidia bacterium]MBN8692781.1 hypothetical protein [Bacteroidota bacterium]